MTERPAAGGDSRFVSNTAALGISMVVTTVLTLVQVKILAAYLPQDVFGAFAALRGFSLLIAMVAANGLPQLLIRFLPHHESHRQLAGALVLSGACFLGPLFLLSVLVFVVETNRAFFFDFVSADTLNPSMLLWFYATTLGVSLKLVLYGGLNGLRRLGAQVTLELATLGVQLVWIFLWRDRLDLTGLFMILGVVSLAGCVVGFPWYFRRLAADAGSGREKTVTIPAADYRRYWYGAAGLSVVAIAFTDVDRYLLSQVLTLEMLALFHIGSRIVRLANRFLSVPVLAFQPEVTRVDAEGRRPAVVTSTTVFVKFNVALSVLIAFILVTMAPEIVRLITTADYSGAVPLLVILTLSVPFSAATAPLTAVMKALDQVRHAFYCDLTWAVTYVGLLILLGGYYGLTGAGLAQLSAALVQLLLAVTLSRSGLRPGFFAGLYGRVVFCGLTAFAPVILVRLLLDDVSYAAAIKTALVVAGIVIYKVMARAVSVFSMSEREILTSMLARKGFGFIAERLLK